MTTTAEQIVAAARKRCKTKDIDLGDGLKVSVRELTGKEKRELDNRLWKKDADGTFVIVDKEGKPTKDDGFYVLNPGVDFRREWMLAAMTPMEAVDGILSEDVPESLKREIIDAARSLNGQTLASAAGN